MSCNDNDRLVILKSVLHIVKRFLVFERTCAVTEEQEVVKQVRNNECALENEATMAS